MNVKKKAGFAAFLAGLFSVSAGAQEPASSNETEEVLEEIIVTGTHIRGAAPVGSPLITIERADIDAAGFGSVPQLIETLPQNFGGDASSDRGRAGGFANISGGTGVNLRGLGNSSTLVLVNGRRRTQSGGLNASYVDVSGIPLSAIERVEILPDGASAVYGSDAIAGVINFILRDDYDGAETRVRYGDSMQGGGEEIKFAQTFGRASEKGNILLSYEYNNSDSLGNDQRDFTSSEDLRSFGGDDFRDSRGNPGTITNPAQAAIPEGQDGTALVPGDLVLGGVNLHNENVGKDLVFDQETHNVFLLANRQLSDKVEVVADFQFGKRDFDQRWGHFGTTLRVPDSHPYFVTPVPGATQVSVGYNFIEDFGPLLSTGDVESYSGSFGVNVDLGTAWKADFTAAYSDEETFNFLEWINFPNLSEALGRDNPSTAFDPTVDGYFNPFADGSNTPQNVLDYVKGGSTRTVIGNIWSVNATVDGPLFEMPGGPVMAAFGGAFREEETTRELRDLIGPSNVFSTSFSGELSRQVSAVFGELLIPLVGEKNGRTGIEKLEVSLSVRHEDYNDFGTTTNPKFGVAWSPFEGLSLRGSFGTSFRAPTHLDLLPQGQLLFASNIPNTQGGTTLSLRLNGSNPDLGPETADTWSAGIDFTPANVPGLSVEITYFNIAFEDRIGRLPGSSRNALLNIDLWAPVVTFDPDDALVQSILDDPTFLNPGAVASASDVEIIVDGRIKNLATTDITGIDFEIAYDKETAVGNVNFSVAGSYMFEFKQAVAVTAPVIELIDTVSNPVGLRLRGATSWNRGGFTASIFANYIDSYTDDVSIPERKISSWTTFDLNLAYDTRDSNGGLRNTRFSLVAQNLFDKDPPFVNNAGIGYDQSNAGPLGGLVSFTITKAW